MRLFSVASLISFVILLGLTLSPISLAVIRHNRFSKIAIDFSIHLFGNSLLSICHLLCAQSQEQPEAHVTVSEVSIFISQSDFQHPALHLHYIL